MSIKAMIFVDGSWFYHSRQILFDSCGEDGFEIDYKRLPVMVRDTLSDTLDADIDIVRTCYFGTLPVNKHGYNPAKQRIFYDFLSQQCQFDTEVVEIDHKVETAVTDDRCVGVALSSSAMQMAMLPGVLDIAVIVGGSFEYKSLLRRLRSLGRRTALVTMQNKDAEAVTSPSLLSEHGLLDFPPIFLDQHINDLRLVRKEQMRACKLCGKEEMTTWAGPEFFCANCRTDHRRRVRVCDTCGREEETSWDKNYFYCTQCRKQYREGKPADEQK